MKLFRILALQVVAVLLISQAAFADNGRVRLISVQGNQRIETETIRSYLTVDEGDPFEASTMDQSLKDLYATGLFADVSLTRQGDTLVVTVKENPIVNQVAFEGNRRLEDSALEGEIQLRPRAIFSRSKAQDDVKRILDLYRRSGRYGASVEPKIIVLDENRVDVVFEISEGAGAYVSRISFIGNKEYSESTLRDEIQTKEEVWYRFFSSDDTYDPDRVNYDRELLRRYYLRHGYADFRVVSSVAELTPDRENFFLTFTIEEGERYRVGEVTIASTLKGLEAEDLEDLLLMKQGGWYNADQVEKTTTTLIDVAGTRGYAFVDVRPSMSRNVENRTIDIHFDVQEGPRVFVERINITGNVRTMDNVIRREMRLVEGDAFNAERVRQSRKRLMDLGYFNKVDVNNSASDLAADKAILDVHVEEKSTGELMFGVGWSSLYGPLAEVSVRERNLLGRGQDLRASVSVGTRRNQADLSFTEPYFLNRELAAGIDLFIVERDMQDESSYDSSSVGASIRMGYQLSESWRQDWRYTIRQDDIFNVDRDASRYIQEQRGKSTVSMITHALMYDQRDSKINPTEGYYLRMVNEFAGVGGTEKFIRNNFSGGYYYPLGDQIVFSALGQVGYVFGYGSNDVSIAERYFLGGDLLRGFALAGVGPRAADGTDDALGGNWMYAGSLQVDFPLGLPQELGLTGKFFTDFGTVGKPDNHTKYGPIHYDSSLRVSIGTGISWRSPMGPVSVDFGFPIMKEDYDDKEVFRVNFGTRF